MKEFKAKLQQHHFEFPCKEMSPNDKNILIHFIFEAEYAQAEANKAKSLSDYQKIVSSHCMNHTSI